MELLLMLLGFVLYVLMGMIKTKKGHPDKVFSVKQYLKDDILIIVAAGVSALILFLTMAEWMPILDPKYDGLTKLFAAVVGFSGYGFWKMIMDTIIPKKYVEK